MKKEYTGLEVTFVPTSGTDIVTASPSTCEIVSVQYYATKTGGECATDVDEGFGEGYSHNWNRRPY